MNLTRINWPQGWRPSDNEINGSPEGLLRMDNLSYDEEGALILARGATRVNTVDFGFDVNNIYSKFINSVKYRFVALSDATVRVTTDGNNYSNIINGGSATNCGFTSGLGFVYAFSGTQRVKFDGTNSTYITPDFSLDAPQVQEAAKNDFAFVNSDFSSFVLIDGENLDNFSTYCQFDTLDGKGRVDYTFSSKDSMTMGAGGTGQPTDLFWLVCRISDRSVLNSVEIVFSLSDEGAFEPPNDDPTKPVELYRYKWNNTPDSTIFPLGADSWVVLKCLRQDFEKERLGGDSDYVTQDWSSVNALSVRVESTGPFTFRINENGILFTGSNTNPMSGLYEYIQVNVNNAGSCFFRSKPSPISKYVTLLGGAAQITPAAVTDPQVNELWFYRRDVTWMQDVREIGEPRSLDKWYRVAVRTDLVSAFTDDVSDQDALIENQTYPIDPWSVSEYTDDVITAATEPFNGRLVLMGAKDIYFTYEEDFGLYSPLWTVRLSGDSTERNLWIKKVSTNQIFVGTTSDIYEITGTCQELPEGILDVRITPMGVEYPPVDNAVALDSGIIFYIASDGVRTFGSGATLLSPQLSLLFQGLTRHGISPIDKAAPDYRLYALEVCQGKVWFVAPLQDGTRKTFVFDILRQRWWFWTQGPWSLYAEEDDTLLGGYGNPDPTHLKVLYTGNTIDGVGQDIHLLTIFDDNQQPRNRKDVFTLKLTADTGNSPVLIELAKDSGNFINLGTHSFNGVQETLIEIATTVGLGFRYALRITGSGLTTFKLLNFTIEYDPRPEQLNYLRIPYNNLGTVSRKRFITYAIVVDTLNNTIQLTPLIDGVPYAASSITLNRKGTHIHYFTSDTIGTDIGAILTGGTFEYYSLNHEEIVSEKLPVPTKYLLIPANDYGNPNRKRHSSYKFQIHTRGAQVRFTPRIDGVNYASLDFSTTEKQTVEYFFTSDTSGIDIGGVLESLADTPFEFYGVIVPQQLEIFPPRLLEFRIPENNYGVPAKKRTRTMPMSINTNGQDVVFTPIVDNVAQTPTTFNTAVKQTVLHYFTDDQFGIDYSGELVAQTTTPFEFYGLERPVDVEVLPVGKKYDQVGPLDMDRLGKLHGFRIKVMTTGTALPFSIYVHDEYKWGGVITTEPNKLKIYEVMRVPKTILGTSMRIEFGPTADVFHRYWVKVRCNISGNDTEIREFPIS